MEQDGGIGQQGLIRGLLSRDDEARRRAGTGEAAAAYGGDPGSADLARSAAIEASPSPVRFRRSPVTYRARSSQSVALRPVGAVSVFLYLNVQFPGGYQGRFGAVEPVYAEEFRKQGPCRFGRSGSVEACIKGDGAG